MGEQELKEVTRHLEGLVTRLESLFADLLAEECPTKEQVYRQTLREAIKVLSATRGSFRSRRLKELRERVEAVLEES